MYPSDLNDPRAQIGWNRVNQILAPCLGEFFCLILAGVQRLIILAGAPTLEVAKSGDFAVHFVNKEFAMTEDDTTITRRRLGGCC